MQPWTATLFLTGSLLWGRWLAGLLWAMLVLLGLCATGSVHAAAEGASSSTNAACDWANPAPRLALTPQLHYLKEAPGQPLDWQEALAQPHWQPSNLKDMAALHGSSTLWLQLEVVNTAPIPVTRVVALDFWVLNDVQLWLLDADGRKLLAHQRSGQALAPQQRALNSEVPAFSVTLAPGQQARLLLRMSDRYWSHVQLDAWEDATFVRAQLLPKLSFAVVSGAALAVCVMLLLLHSKLLAITSVWVLLSLLLELAFAGLLSEFVLPAREFSPGLLILAVGWLTSCASAFVTMYFMGLERHPFWYRWNWGMVALSLLLAWVMHGNYSYLARQAMLLFTVVQVLGNMTMLVSAQLRGYPWRQWMAALLIVNFGVAVGRVLLRQFYVEPETYELLMSAVMVIKGIRVLLVIGLVALQRNSEARQVRQRLHEAESQQRQDLQAAVEQRTAELRQALVAATEANSAKTDFLARISHDLRSPLTSISGYAQLLQRQGEQTGRLAQTIRRSADHMQAMVNDLIEYASGSHTDRPEPSPLYIHGFLEDIAHTAKGLAARRNNQFTLQLESELPPVLVLDGKRLRQMLTNLLDNAAKFTQNGQITLRVSARPLTAAPEQPQRLAMRLAVQDSGPGIAQAEQSKLFEPFYRTSNAEEGTQGMGLGLSIVHTWAQRLGGSIELSSTPGQGSIFTLCLPVEVGVEADMSPQQWQDCTLYLPPLQGQGKRIWVVEDNHDIRELLAEELRSVGFEVQALADGAAFLDAMQTPHLMVPDLVLTDYLMPGADGAAVLQAVRFNWAGVPVVLLSATQKTMQAIGSAQDLGFDASLMKPVNLAELRSTVAALLQLSMTDEHLEPEVPDSTANAMPALTLPPNEELETVRLWVDMGALTDLTEWTESLAQRHPECAAFSQRMLTLLVQARFNDIRALCATEHHTL